MGGPSAEREISLLSGNAVLKALVEKGVDAHGFDPKERPILELKREGFDRVFIALHGRFGEDGTVQGALETLGIPYNRQRGHGFRARDGQVADQARLDRERYPDASLSRRRRCHRLDASRCRARAALIVKPAREGSTIGITKVTTVDGGELGAAYEVAAKHDDLVLVEEFVAGVELTASILGTRALPLIRIEAPQGNYDYHNKYFSDDTEVLLPSRPSRAKEFEIRAASLAAFEIVGCSGWGRLDLILKADGSFQFLEVQHVPGMTGHSLVPMAAREAGMSFGDLCSGDSARRACGMTRDSSTRSPRASCCCRSRRCCGRRSRGRRGSRLFAFARSSSAEHSRTSTRRNSSPLFAASSPAPFSR
jgi:D-alanine-D-alanine ligase